MNLTILLPSTMLLQRDDVTRLVVATSCGSWGIMPHRRDCVAVLIPGILTLEGRGGEVTYVAVDGGVMTKCGFDVRASVHRAMIGTDLGGLRATVENEYSKLSQAERQVRQVSEKLEMGLLRRIAALHHE